MSGFGEGDMSGFGDGTAGDIRSRAVDLGGLRKRIRRR
jgi:hypothetical protein